MCILPSIFLFEHSPLPSPIYNLHDHQNCILVMFYILESVFVEFKTFVYHRFITYLTAHTDNYWDEDFCTSLILVACDTLPLLVHLTFT